MISSSNKDEFGKVVVIDYIDHVGTPKHTALKAAKIKDIVEKLKKFSMEGDKIVILPNQGKHHMQFIHDDLVVTEDFQQVEDKVLCNMSVPTGMGKTAAGFGLLYGSSVTVEGTVWKNAGWGKSLADVQREEREERARKYVLHFLRGPLDEERPNKGRGKLAHYKEPTYRRPKRLPAQANHSNLSYLVSSFAQKEIDRLQDGHEKQIADIYQTKEVHIDQFKNKLKDTERQLEDMTRERDEALQELNRIRERNASIVRIMSAEGRRFRQ